MIYAYEDKAYPGLLKVGYTAIDVQKRVAQQYPTLRPGALPYRIVLEEPAMRLLPEIRKIKELLLGFGLKIVQMTGSGSAVFALSTDKQLLKKIENLLEDKYIVELTTILK